VQTRGSALARLVLKWAGWQLDYDGLPAGQGIIVVYPHTSNWDFVVGILAKWAMGFPAGFWGKDSLFRVPLLGAWLRWLGGVPVDRQSPRGLVGEMVQRMVEAREADRGFWLAIAPEGTRSRSQGWRSGFYRVALGAGVPLGVAHLDFGRRRVGFSGFFMLSGDRQADMAALADCLEPVRGLHHEKAAPIQLRDT
jgi:1-acyl-sn-glycerol-3-phosphate acyltransferase